MQDIQFLHIFFIFLASMIEYIAEGDNLAEKEVAEAKTHCVSKEKEGGGSSLCVQKLPDWRAR